MRALIWTAPHKLEMGERERPEPRPDEVVLRVCYAGICGSDLTGYLGHNPLRRPPLVMGHEFTGVVVAAGAGVDGLCQGETVVVNPLIGCGSCNRCRSGQPQQCSRQRILGIHLPGAFSDLVKVPASACHPVQDAWTAVVTEPLACAVRAVRRAGVGLGDRVAIFGAGAIGLLCLRAATLCGASVRVSVDLDDRRLELARASGATHTVNARTTDPVDAILALSDEGMDQVIEAVGVQQTRRQAFAVAARGGRVVLLGLHQDSTELPVNDWVRHELEVLGSASYTPGDFQEALRLVRDRQVVVGAPWTVVRQLEEGPAAFESLLDGREAAPKVVLAVHPQ
ncbi:MAG: alcohol dehydrogenase catalytic domain-containing protein [Alicyclobacillus macrosporangiidus]|uniref:zinc-dependent alcohol dehydrogenase n=1 Tax=Alicyclobacillus macrosporangiidus TaxID=392015 RepID=UPI0026EF807A|nr:alcohol dehydrogenase catalytic domain-containing protein [Alicyclobacillus macrosporangiidus]MCL6599476.1 alcohol dehydrogenase catalytic domain-containing protein [Alicyclobacillus macrosporangiidus]